MGKDKPGPYKRALAAAEARANATRREGEGIVFHDYPDYATYREVQVAGNKAKLRMQFVKESHIRALAEYLNARGPVDFGICHGTRRGREQAWFAAHLHGEPHVIGTEISDTAKAFENTIEWDFHDENPDWAGRADFVYSNSWDHAFDPERAFGAWIAALKPGGVMLLDHTRGQEPAAANALDPFGASHAALRSFMADHFGDRGAVADDLDFRANCEYRARVLVFRKS